MTLSMPMTYQQEQQIDYLLRTTRKPYAEIAREVRVSRSTVQRYAEAARLTRPKGRPRKQQGRPAVT